MNEKVLLHVIMHEGCYSNQLLVNRKPLNATTMAEERNIEALNELLKKVIYAQKTYERAGKSVHSDVFRTKLETIAREREAYKEKIKQEIIARHGSPKSEKSINFLIQEIYMMFSDLHMEKNVPDLLKLCIQADEELLDQHIKVMKQEHFVKENDPLAQLIYGQYDQVREMSGEFNKELEAYPWK